LQIVYHRFKVFIIKIRRIFVSRLPEETKEAVVRSLGEGMPITLIAHSLGINRETVKRIHDYLKIKGHYGLYTLAGPLPELSNFQRKGRRYGAWPASALYPHGAISAAVLTALREAGERGLTTAEASSIVKKTLPAARSSTVSALLRRFCTREIARREIVKDNRSCFRYFVKA
jgi:hypothetical protein